MLVQCQFCFATYCFLHILHVIRYGAFAVLQLWLPLMDEMALDVALNVFDGRIMLHIWQRMVLILLEQLLRKLVYFWHVTVWVFYMPKWAFQELYV